MHRVLNHVGVSSDEEERNEKLFQPAKRRPVLDSENDENNPISLSPSFEEKRTAAEAKLWSKKLNATTLGQSWMKVLVPEFKKQYFQEVDMSDYYCSYSFFAHNAAYGVCII